MDLAVALGILLSIAVVWATFLVIFWALRPRGTSAREIVVLVPDVLRLLRAVVVDRTAPLDARPVLIGLLAWIVSPIDLIPEFIPVIGPLDDVVVAVVALRYVGRRIGVKELQRRWTGTEEGFALLLRVIGMPSPGRP